MHLALQKSDSNTPTSPRHIPPIYRGTGWAMEAFSVCKFNWPHLAWVVHAAFFPLLLRLLLGYGFGCSAPLVPNLILLWGRVPVCQAASALLLMTWRWCGCLWKCRWWTSRQDSAGSQLALKELTPTVWGGVWILGHCAGCLIFYFYFFYKFGKPTVFRKTDRNKWKTASVWVMSLQQLAV